MKCLFAPEEYFDAQNFCFEYFEKHEHSVLIINNE